MTKFHVGDNGPGLCSAQNGRCPYGGAQEHYGSREDAQKAFEMKMNEQYSSTATVTDGSAGEKKVRSKKTILTAKEKFDEAERNFIKEATDKVEPVGINEVLSPPIYPVRERGSWLLEAKDFDENEFYGTGLTKEYFEHYPYIVELRTRQGGGNRDCYCSSEEEHNDGSCLEKNNEEMQSHRQYLTDADDMFDSTYASFFFEAGEKEVKEYLEKRDKYREFHKKSAILQDIQKGALPPWAFREEFDQNLYQEYKNHSYKISSKKEAYEEMEKTIAEEEANIEKFKRDEMKISDFPYPQNRSLPRPRYSFQELNNQKALVKEKQALIKEAKELPEGLLKAELLKKDSPLNRDRINEERKLREIQENLKKTLTPLLQRVEEMKEENTKNVPTKTEINSLNKLRKQSWQSGFYDSLKNLPPIPETF